MHYKAIDNHLTSSPPNLYLYWILLILLFFQGCGNNESESLDQSDLVTPDTLNTDTFNIVVSTESNLFAAPAEIVHIDNDRFAVLDLSQNVVKIMARDGSELIQFGGEGSGPGEWETTSNYLSYSNERFLITDVGSIRLNIYTIDGSPLAPFPIETWARYTSKVLIDESTLLVGTGGREETLALLMDIDNPDDPLLKIGTPDIPTPVGLMDLSEISQAIANGEVPALIINETILTAGNGGYYLFMNALGELRFYNEDGVMNWNVEMPETVKAPLHDFYIERNENAPPSAYAGIEYASAIRFSNNRIYILTFPVPGINQQLLIYSTEGSLLRQIVLDNNTENEITPMFGRFDIMPDGTFILPDIQNARILSFDL